MAVTLTVAGCKQISSIGGKNEKQDLLEAELRTREREILELRSENTHLRGLTDLYTRSGAGPVVSSGPAVPGGGVLTSGEPNIVRGVALATGTGGRDDDGLPGDELLQVVIAPKDADGTAVKVPGRAVVSAVEFSPEGQDVPIGRWDVSAEQLRRAWKGGLLGSGYFLPLQWDLPPTSSKVRVTVQFTTTDGKPFKSDRDVTVKPLPGLARPTVTTPVVPLGPVPPTTLDVPKLGTVLPPPSGLLPLPEFPK